MTKYVVVNVDCIPCDVTGSEFIFDANGNKVSDSFKSKWPMPWIESGILALHKSGACKDASDPIRVFNPDEPDQYIDVELFK